MSAKTMFRQARYLLDCVIANPDDDLTRLVLADWIEEHGLYHEDRGGDSVRAEFVRIQVEIDAMPPARPCVHLDQSNIGMTDNRLSKNSITIDGIARGQTATGIKNNQLIDIICHFEDGSTQEIYGATVLLYAKFRHQLKANRDPDAQHERCTIRESRKALEEREKELGHQMFGYQCEFDAIEGYSFYAGYSRLPFELDRISAYDRCVQFRRGLIECVSSPADFWIKHADELTCDHPIREVRLTTLPQIEISSNPAKLRFGGDGDDKWFHSVLLRMSPRGIGENTLHSLFRLRWPSIKFTLPNPIAADWGTRQNATPLADFQALRDAFTTSIHEPWLPIRSQSGFIIRPEI